MKSVVLVAAMHTPGHYAPEGDILFVGVCAVLAFIFVALAYVLSERNP